MSSRRDSMPITCPARFWHLPYGISPLYLLGRVPGFILQDALLNLMWYKLLPVILYFETSHLIYKIGMLIGFGRGKVKDL